MAKAGVGRAEQSPAGDTRQEFHLGRYSTMIKSAPWFGVGAFKRVGNFMGFNLSCLDIMSLCVL